MQFLIRVDSAHHIGAGHFMRCLTLAKQLISSGHQVQFAYATLMQSHIERLNQLGFSHSKIPDQRVGLEEPAEAIWPEREQFRDGMRTAEYASTIKADWIIVDHYGLADAWSRSARSLKTKICVIDDLCNRNHDCDLIFDSSPGRDECEYVNRVPSRTEIKTGLHYFLLRQEAHLISKRSEQSEASSKPRVLISLGGSDPRGQTLKIVEAIRKRYPDLLPSCTVILGSQNQQRTLVEQALGAGSTQILIDPHDFLQCIASSDIIICSASATAIEARFLNRKVIALKLANNQEKLADFLQTDSCVQLIDALPEAKLNLDEAIAQAIMKLSSNTGAALNTKELDGQGAARVAALLTHNSNTRQSEPSILRPLEARDLPMILQWRNHPEIRKCMYRSTPIDSAEHQHWFENSLRNPAKTLLVYEEHGRERGFVSFLHCPRRNSVEWGFYTAPGAPKGTGWRMGQQALNYAFRFLAADKVFGEVITENQASANYHTALGFEELAASQNYNDQGLFRVRNFELTRERYENGL